MNSPTSFSRMNVATTDQAITNSPASSCHFSSVQLPWTTPPAEMLGVLPTPGYTIMFGSAKMPVSRPPARPAKPWV